jgi:hypothetical protein
MNAIEIIERVREHEADLALVDDHLVVRGWAEPLPEELKEAIAKHKGELMVALGEPANHTIAVILADIRPHLPKALQRLPDDKLLALVNWSIIAAFEKAVRTATR